VNAVSAEKAAGVGPDPDVREEVLVLETARARDEAIRLADAGENDAAMQLLSTASTELRRSGLTEEAEALELEQPLLTPHRYADAAARKQLHYESHRRKRGR